ncbi:MAG: YtxH domain-containing protein [Elusimicrobia bacterium]|nr:YtxH domain-containing protein [Elusimicrobiota bacterium]
MAENSGGEIVGAFLVGGLIGAALGILFAPASGKQTREKIVDFAEETKDMAKEKLEKLEAEIKRRKDQLLKQVS